MRSDPDFVSVNFREVVEEMVCSIVGEIRRRPIGSVNFRNLICQN